MALAVTIEPAGASPIRMRAHANNPIHLDAAAARRLSTATSIAPSTGALQCQATTPIAGKQAVNHRRRSALAEPGRRVLGVDKRAFLPLPLWPDIDAGFRSRISMKTHAGYNPDRSVPGKCSCAGIRPFVTSHCRTAFDLTGAAIEIFFFLSGAGATILLSATALEKLQVICKPRGNISKFIRPLTECR